VITIRDVGPRDGLQSEAPVAPAERAALAVALADAGLCQIEAVSFVSPKAVPSMAGADEVVLALPRRGAVTWWALVPNAKGAELALAAGMRHLTVTVSASEGYSQKNVGRSTDDAVDGLAQIATAADGAAINAQSASTTTSVRPQTDR
jgi:hydroxymethylglutaryl-CoA lyase